MTMRWPEGVESGGVAAGIKPERNRDLGVIVARDRVSWAGTFTKNAAAAAPVQWCKARLGERVRAVVVNSGNANACTGPAGEAAVHEIARVAASNAGCAPDEVLVASTGPIGVQLPVELVAAVLPGAFASSSNSVETFAEAILTTDTRPKLTERKAGDARIVGVAKGAAMLAPNMATMLAFLVTDGTFDAGVLQSALDRAVSRSFDRISVDACESTNDSVFLLATGRVPGASEEELAHELEGACADLAEQMVRDAEGGSKLVRIRVAGARDEDAAVSLGRAVAGSALWRAAAHGGDPNWGRILSALGAADRSLQLDSLELAIGPSAVFVRGVPAASLDAAAKHMAGDVIEVSCLVGEGPGSAEVLSADLSPEYVTLNAYGTT